MILSDVPGDVKLSKVSPSDIEFVIKKNFNTILFNGFNKSSYNAKNYCRSKYAVRLLRCAYNLTFLFGKDQEGNLKSRLVDAKFCRINVCPICHWRWSLKWRYYLSSAIDQILREKPSYRFLFLTLTIRNCDISELSSVLDLMAHSWSKMLKLKEFANNSSIKGFFRSLEVSRSKSGQAHPHYHCLICVSSSYFKSGYYLTFENYQRIWRDSLGIDYNPSVFVKLLDSGQVRFKVGEIAKYLTKVSDLIEDIEWTLRLSDHLFKVRRVSATGIFKDKLRGIKEDDLLHITDRDLEWLELESLRLYEWQEKLKEYIENVDERVYAGEFGPELLVSSDDLFDKVDDCDLYGL